MTYAATPGGMYFPYFLPANFNTGTATALNAAGEMVAMIGNVYIEGRVSSKTIDTSGSSAIQFRTAGVTLSNGTTALSVGIQDVSAVLGQPGQPDGTFDVSTVITNAAAPTANAWNTFAMTGGTKTLTHGQLIAVVWDMTARGGADSVSITPGANGTSPGLSYYVTNIDGAGWTIGTALANCVITFSDGTLGYLDFAMPISAALNEQFRDIDNPDERALVFQVPWNCKVDALWANVGGQSSTASFNLTLYSDPLGTPASMVSSAVNVQQLGASVSTAKVTVFNLSTEQVLARNTNYAVAIRATGATSTRIVGATLGDSSHRTFYPGGTTLTKGTRDGGSGAFAQTSTILYQFGVRISQFDDGTGSGSAGVMYNPNLEGT